MIFVDSNIPMYAAGVPSPQKEACLSFLDKVNRQNIQAVSSAEVLQEILHRYRAIKKLNDGFKVYDAFRNLPIRWLDILVDDVDSAKDLLGQYPHLSSRDSLHLAVMRRQGITKMVTYDQDFLGVPGFTVFLPDSYQKKGNT